MRELDNLFEQYIDKFGEGFPSFQVLRNKTEEESCKVVRECIEKGKDAYQLGLCTDDPDILY